MIPTAFCFFFDPLANGNSPSSSSSPFTSPSGDAISTPMVWPSVLSLSSSVKRTTNAKGGIEKGTSSAWTVSKPPPSRLIFPLLASAAEAKMAKSSSIKSDLCSYPRTKTAAVLTIAAGKSCLSSCPKHRGVLPALKTFYLGGPRLEEIGSGRPGAYWINRPNRKGGSLSPGFFRRLDSAGRAGWAVWRPRWRLLPSSGAKGSVVKDCRLQPRWLVTLPSRQSRLPAPPSGQ